MAGEEAQRASGAEAERAPTIAGVVRRGRRTKDLVKRIGPGEVAVIDHADLDRIASEDLAALGLAAVLNDAASTTDRYPNMGPLILARSGTPLVDFPDVDLFEALDDGDLIRLEGSTLYLDGEAIAEGHAHTLEVVERRLERQRAEIDKALADFASNTIAHVREESELLSGRIELPPLRTELRDQHVLIVVRGPDYKQDLAALAAYARDVRPRIIAVDGAADAVIEAGLQPDLVLGDMDSATDRALGSGAELVVHAYPDGRAPGRRRLQEMGLPHVIVPAPGTSQDVAMLLAHEGGAALIVMVGAHFNLIEFLDKNRAGMSSTFLTRLRVGETLVDAKGVSRLYQPGLRRGGMAAFAAAFLLIVAIVVLASPGLDNVFDLLWLRIRDALGL